MLLLPRSSGKFDILSDLSSSFEIKDSKSRLDSVFCELDKKKTKKKLRRCGASVNYLGFRIAFKQFKFFLSLKYQSQLQRLKGLSCTDYPKNGTTEDSP